MSRLPNTSRLLTDTCRYLFWRAPALSCILLRRNASRLPEQQRHRQVSVRVSKLSGLCCKKIGFTLARALKKPKGVLKATLVKLGLWSSSIVMAISLVFSSQALAWEWDFSGWTWGYSVGLGGTGITKTVNNNGADVDVSRGETPGMFGIEISKMTGDTWRTSIGHRRGFRLGPFSSGVGFTTISWNWYYLGPPPLPVSAQAPDYVTEDTWEPFLGFSTGLAQGTITRDGDEVGSVTSSGAIIGIRVGADYRSTPNLVYRPEIVGSQTFFNSSAKQSSLSEFGLMWGFTYAFD